MTCKEAFVGVDQDRPSLYNNSERVLYKDALRRLASNKKGGT